MRPLTARRPTWPIAPWLCLAALLIGPTARATSPRADHSAVDSKAIAGDADATLGKALEFERNREWAAAVEVYSEAQDIWPSRVEFGHRRRLCEIHNRLVRRYQDVSFRKVLLKLSPERTLELFDELVERIDSQYVDPVAFEPLLRRGIDNILVALRDETFLKWNAKSPTPKRIERLRVDLLARRERLHAPDRFQARNEVLAVARLAEADLGLPEAASMLEFVYGACDALDDYTSCLTPDKLDDLYAMIDGNFVGLGVELKQDAKGLLLVGVLRGGPAFESGLKPGEIITEVAGQSVKGLNLDEAAGRLQGTEGTTVDIKLLRADGVVRTIRMTRRPIEVESVAQAKIVEPLSGIAYVQLTGFQKTSALELDRALDRLRSEGMRYLVLDLRGNPGGLLNVSVEIAERFIDRGVIVSTRGRAPGQNQVYRAEGRATQSLPMAVLIDHDSASASEILAGALKDHRRALVLGERSYGKGSVQSIFSLRTVPAGLKLTTAKFYSPTDRPYSDQGVEPDVPDRVAAKPVAGDAPSAMPEFGDPDRDPVLDQAIARGRKALAPAR